MLSQLCWDDNSVRAVIEGSDYTAATMEPTGSPTTANPTHSPTSRPTPTNTTEPTGSPTSVPTLTFAGEYDNTRKALGMGTISCGIHRQGTLQRKRSNWYTFEVLNALSFWALDTCLNDQTKFDACLKLYKLDGDEYELEESTCDYCGFTDDDNTYLSTGQYAIEIYGDDQDEDYGDYILRMGCDLLEYDYVTPGL